MSNSICDRLMQDFGRSLSYNAQELRPSFIANFVFNGFLSYMAIMFNILTVYAIRKTSSLPQGLKTLLLSLAVSDLGVGFVVQPLYIALLVNRLQENLRNCTIIVAFGIFMTLFSAASFFGVMALIVDRYLAIYLHLRYQELVPHRRVVTSVISIWVFSVLLTLISVWAPKTISSKIIGITGFVCFIATMFLNYKIYLAIRSHASQIQPLQIQEVLQNGEMANTTRLRKSAIGTFYIYFVFLICFLPLILAVVVHACLYDG